MRSQNISSDKKLRVNRQIYAKTVRLIGHDGSQVGVVALFKALEMAEQVGLDLVELSPNTDPPVCKIMDFGKYLYQLTKKRAESKKKQKQQQIKELKYRPTIEEADYQVRLRKILTFLSEGDKVKITLRFRGREAAHMDLGFRLLKRVQQDLGEQALIEQEPKFEGRQLIMLISPNKKKV